MNAAIDKLVSGFKTFHERFFEENKELYQRLVTEGQSPKALVIACADSRVDPAIMLQADPGDIFSIRNVANVVPPYQEGGDVSYHGTSTAIEFAINGLGIKNIVVCGHAHCAGVKAMVSGQEGSPVGGQFVPQWTSIINKGYELAKQKNPGAEGAELDRCCERQSVLVSLENLMTFPFVKEKVDAGELEIHGWYLDIAQGELSRYNPNTDKFEMVAL
ncbi:MAG: carbonic anhydrase [Magnetovibrio sp.]|nr:carbonic anhydrase [Magnetovibrio sp.]